MPGGARTGPLDSPISWAGTGAMGLMALGLMGAALLGAGGGGMEGGGGSGMDVDSSCVMPPGWLMKSLGDLLSIQTEFTEFRGTAVGCSGWWVCTGGAAGGIFGGCEGGCAGACCAGAGLADCTAGGIGGIDGGWFGGAFVSWARS